MACELNAEKKMKKQSSALCFLLFLGGLKVACEYMALQEGVLCEEVLLLSETNDDVCVRVKVHARVMGEVVLSRSLSDNDLDVLC